MKPRYLRGERWTDVEKRAWLREKQIEYPIVVRVPWERKVAPEQVEHHIGDTIAFVGIRSEGVRYYLFRNEDQALKASPLLTGTRVTEVG